MSECADQTLNAWRKRLLLRAAVAALSAIGAFGGWRLRAQTGTPDQEHPTFEVASVKPNKSGDGRVMLGGPPGRFTATNVPLKLLIRNAYQLQDSQIVGGPGWINSDRFDIVATTGSGAPAPLFIPTEQPQRPSRLQLMLRALLADRFKLAVHTETRELQVYALTLARTDGKLGAQLRPVTGDCAAIVAARGRGGPPAPAGPGGGPAGELGRGPVPLPAPGERPPCGLTRMGPGNIASGGANTAQLATMLAPWVNRVVLDKTGLTGTYEVDLQWTPDQMPGGRGEPPPGAPPLPPVDPNGPSLFTAVQEQLGLKLDSQRGAVDVLVIDRVEQPTED